MSLGDEYRGQLDRILYSLSLSVNAMAESEKQMEEVRQEVLILGLQDSSWIVSGTVAVAERQRQQANESLMSMFEIRQRLTDYRNGLG